MDAVVKIKKLNENAILPKKLSNGAAGFDIYSNEEATIETGENKLIKTGFSMELPPGYEAQIRSRSGLALKYKIFVLNSPGTIDEDYRGEVCVIMMNVGDNNFQIKKGDRIAQMIISKVPSVEIQEVDELSNTERGDGGFGSTGKK